MWLPLSSREQVHPSSGRRHVPSATPLLTERVLGAAYPANVQLTPNSELQRMTLVTEAFSKISAKTVLTGSIEGAGQTKELWQVLSISFDDTIELKVRPALSM